MAKCPLHQGRGRAPKDCLACAAGRIAPVDERKTVIQAQRPIRKETATTGTTEAAVSHVKRDTSRLPLSEDGLTWLDADGNPPEFDIRGNLAKDFVLKLPTKIEKFTAGCILPAVPHA